MKNFTIYTIVAAAIFLTNIVSMNAQESIAVIQEPYVILVNPADGVITDPEFIDLTPLGQETPKAILQVGDEIWVSDQLMDSIFRFDLDGNFVSMISVGLDNIKGMSTINNSEVWVTNAGTGNGAPGNALIRFDYDGNNLGFIDTTDSGSSFDIIDTGSEVYIGYIAANTKIEVRDYAGVITGNIVETGVVSFIQQLELNPANNTVYAAVFSSNGANTSGLYEFSITDGSILNYYNEGSLRGVALLDDGNVLISGGNNISLIDTSNSTSTIISSGGASQYFTRINFSACTTPDTPTGASNQTFEEGATLADLVVNPTDVTWFLTEEDANTNNNPLPLSTVLVNGTTYYAVSIVDDCISIPFPVTVTVTLEVDKFNHEDIAVFPNPTRDFLTVGYSDSIDLITISNLLGQRLFNEEVNSNSTIIDISSYTKGIYFVRLYIDNTTTTVKIIKQ